MHKSAKRANGRPTNRNPRVSTIETRPCRLNATVFFVGFMGAGKTSVARKLARMTGNESLDTDIFISQWTGMTPSDIIAEEGEDMFRKTEEAALREIAAMSPRFVSCGGGIVEREESRIALRESGFVVFLQVKPEDARGRISNWESRPLLGDLEESKRRCEARRPLYEEVANLSLCTDGLGSTSVAHRVKRCLFDAGILRNN